jgi:hypothetical protein
MDLPQWIHILYEFPPSLQTPPVPAMGFYLTISSGSMRISPFSMNNIFIQRGISSKFPSHPSANFLSASLKESVYSMKIQ